MPFLKFTVDSALLQELGERLVGRPYVALAELVKNGYDADASQVTIEMNPDEDRIVVRDTGDGMDFKEFKNFWMRIGSIHKRRQQFSRKLNRPLTGSKGIGRLAVQYLAKELELITTSEKNLHNKLRAHVKWEEAARATELTEAQVEYDIETSDDRFKRGTEIILKGLKQEWSADFIRGLAKEIWWLQPPFRKPLVDTPKRQKAFEIELVSKKKAFERIFSRQIGAVLKIWHAKLVGKNVKGDISLSLEFRGEDPITINYSLGSQCTLENGDFEIRIYRLLGRQPEDISVQDARNYFDEFGGVHVYDGGFHLPYYGDPRNDWLRLEYDVRRRYSISKLLPDDLQVSEAMYYLPSLSRIFGVVNVQTSEEPDLDILITRDRFRESVGLSNLTNMVRWALDFYATREKLRRIEEFELIQRIEKPKVVRVKDVLEKYRPNISPDVFENFKEDVEEVLDEFETESEIVAKRVGLMGSLATAGISALAYQHETKSQFLTMDTIIQGMENLTSQIEDLELRKALTELKDSLSLLVDRAKATNALFSYFATPENLQTRSRFQVKKVIDEIKEQIGPLARGSVIQTGKLDEELLFPEASLAEWSAIFQNVFLNAFNALLDSEKKLIAVSSRVDNRLREILIQDTGCGVDLKDAEELFKPFIRRLKISPERQALGYGGTGLGLTIVRMVARNIRCEVSFVEPGKGFSTAFSLRWREKK